jgi:hypothetical protein
MVFAYQISQFGHILEVFRMENVGIFYGHFVPFVVMRYTFYHFCCTKKIWHSWYEHPFQKRVILILMLSGQDISLRSHTMESEEQLENLVRELKAMSQVAFFCFC